MARLPDGTSAVRFVHEFPLVGHHLRSLLPVNYYLLPEDITHSLINSGVHTNTLVFADGRFVGKLIDAFHVVAVHTDDSTVAPHPALLGSIDIREPSDKIRTSLTRILKPANTLEDLIKQLPHQHFLASLTPAQFAAFNLSCRGLVHKESARVFNVAEATIKTHLGHAMRSLRSTSRHRAIARYNVEFSKVQLCEINQLVDEFIAQRCLGRSQTHQGGTHRANGVPARLEATAGIR